MPVALIAPPRLNPAVRDALQQILATLDSPTLPLAAFVIELGVFVPLDEFERRSVDPALAVRALSDDAHVGQLIQATRSRRRSHAASMTNRSLALCWHRTASSASMKRGPSERTPSEPHKP